MAKNNKKRSKQQPAPPPKKTWKRFRRSHRALLATAVLGLPTAVITALLFAFVGVATHLDNFEPKSTTSPSEDFSGPTLVAILLGMISLVATAVALWFAKQPNECHTRLAYGMALLSLIVLVAGFAVGQAFLHDDGCFRTCAPFPR